MNGMQWNILYMLICFSEIYLYYWFFCESLQKHFAGAGKWLLMAFLTILSFAADISGINPLLKLCCMFLIGTFLTVWIYKSSIASSILLNGLFFFITIAGEALTSGLLLLFYKGTDISIIRQEHFLLIQCLAFSKLMDFIFIVLGAKLLNREKEKYTMKEAGIMLIQAIASVLCLMLIVEFSYYQSDGLGIGILFLGILSFIIIVFYFVSYYVIDGYFSYRTKEKDFLLMDMRNERMMANYAQIEKTSKMSISFIMI